jgi:TRAP-type uncharacterized transport system fused permease subunit
MVEIDARKFNMPEVVIQQTESLWRLTRKYWFHFLSLVSIVVFMVLGFSPIASVFWATIVSFAVSFLRPETAMGPKKLIAALRDGSRQVLNVAATCAAAGIIVGVVGKTGLGLKFSAIVIAYAGGNLLLTAVYTSLIVWIIGLAVPVTASYIICAVIAARRDQIGRADFAAHVYLLLCRAVRSISTNRAFSFAAAAITGGNPYKTTLQSWKYAAGFPGAVRIRA